MPLDIQTLICKRFLLRVMLMITVGVALIEQHGMVFASAPRIYVLDREVTAADDSRVVDVDEPATISCTHDKNVTWSFLNVIGEVEAVPRETFNYSGQGQLYTSTVDLQGSNTTSAVGLYRCVAQDDVACRWKAGPGTDEHCLHKVSSVYIYLRGSNVGPLVVGSTWRYMDHQMEREEGRPFTVPCKPSNPEATVTLENSIHEVLYNRPQLQTGFMIPGNVSITSFECKGSFEGRNATLTFYIRSFSMAPLEPPEVRVEGARQRNDLGDGHLNYDVVSGSNVTVLCHNGPSRATCRMVNRVDKTISIKSHKDGWQKLTLLNLTESGEVDCYITNRHVNSSTVTTTLKVIEPTKRYLELGPVVLAEEGDNRLSWRVNFRAHGTPRITWTKVGDPDVILLETPAEPGVHRSGPYCITIQSAEGAVEKVMLSTSEQALGAYTITATLGALNQTVAFNYTKRFAPKDTKISVSSGTTKLRVSAPLRLECSSVGFPSPDLLLLTSAPCKLCDATQTIFLINSTVQEDCNSTLLHCKFSAEKNTVFYASFLNSTSVHCSATNALGNQSSEELRVEVYDTPTDVFDRLVVELQEDLGNFRGFGRPVSLSTSGGGIQDYHNASVVEGGTITLQCRARLNQLLVWQHDTGSGCHEKYNNPCTNLTAASQATTSTTSISTVSAVTVTNISLEHEGCRCWVCTDSATRETVALLLTIQKSVPPHFPNANWLQPFALDLDELGILQLQCPVTGVPLPTVTWYKNDRRLTESVDDRVNITKDTLSIIHSMHADSGPYKCVATSRAGTVQRTVHVTVLSRLAKASTVLLSVVAVISVMLVIVSTMVCYRIVQDRKKKRQLRKEEQELFEATHSDLLDPNLSPQEQVDLLPYKPSYAIDRDCLIFERQLGVGAFGRVYQAQLITRVPGELPTTVAVKTIKSKTNNEHVRAFRSEIKILMYLGRHRNIINLIGVCSKDMVDKGEMLMVVEYCRHKSLLDYMRSNRRNFEEQTSGMSDDGLSINPCSSTVYWPAGTVYQNSGTIGTLPVTPTTPGPSSPLLLETLASVTGRSVSELTKSRLMDWTLQVANGMAFLAGKKIIHGDLATRNILLTEENVIKVADFGLAKDVYNKVDNIYKLDTNRVLAIKWAALETLKFSELTTASDVWAFGVVMWEIFSLGANPYSEVENLMNFLESGSRLQKPKHSNDLLYSVMLQCWQQLPADRPTFEMLEHTLRNFDLLSENMGEINPSFQANCWGDSSGPFTSPYAGLDHSTTTTYLPMTVSAEPPPVSRDDDVTSQNSAERNTSSRKSLDETNARTDSTHEQEEKLLGTTQEINGEKQTLSSAECQSRLDDRKTNCNSTEANDSCVQIQLMNPPRRSEYVPHSQSNDHGENIKCDPEEGVSPTRSDFRDCPGENNLFAKKATQIQTNPEYVLLSTTTAPN